MSFTFSGGVRLKGFRGPAEMKTEILPAPPEVVIPVTDLAGRTAEIFVTPGDSVLVGQKIGRFDGDFPVYSSVSGTFIGTEPYEDGGEVCAVIKNDGEDTPASEFLPIGKKLSDCTPDEIIERVRAAGIGSTGRDGTAAYEAMLSVSGKAVRMIVSFIDDEPYVTSLARFAFDGVSRVINGAKIIMKALGLRHTLLAVDTDNLSAANELERLIFQNPLFEVGVFKSKYPQGEKDMLIEAAAEKYGIHGETAVFDAQTCAAVYDALAAGIPFIRRNVTVAGDLVRRPMNFIVPAGTRAGYLAECAGGLSGKPAAVLFGGPMAGTTVSLNAPLTLDVSAVLFLSDEPIAYTSSDPVCIRCGRCVRVCPVKILPCTVADHAVKGELEMCKKYGALRCTGCGCCSYVCPAGLELTENIRAAREKISADGGNI